MNITLKRFFAMMREYRSRLIRKSNLVSGPWKLVPEEGISDPIAVSGKIMGQIQSGPDPK
jgi:hypothetical protein